MKRAKITSLLIQGEPVKKVILITILLFSVVGLWAQQFSIPAGAVLIESTEFKNNGVTYIIEQRYRLTNGEILYAYYDVDGSNSVTIQKTEQQPILALGKEINIKGMPGYREFNFGQDKRQLVQFMKIMKLGEKKSYTKDVKTPSLSDHIFSGVPGWRDEYKLLLDLYDETWVLEYNQYSGNNLASHNTTALIRVVKFTE